MTFHYDAEEIRNRISKGEDIRLVKTSNVHISIDDRIFESVDGFKAVEGFASSIINGKTEAYPIWVMSCGPDFLVQPGFGIDVLLAAKRCQVEEIYVKVLL